MVNFSLLFTPLLRIMPRMKAYQLAVSATPNRKNWKEVYITCYTVEITATDEYVSLSSYGNIPEIDLPAIHQFERKVVITEPETIFTAAVDIINAIEWVVTKHKESCASYGLPYSNAAIEIGEDSRKNLNLAAIMAVLFDDTEIFDGIIQGQYEKLMDERLEDLCLFGIGTYEKATDGSVEDVMAPIIEANLFKLLYLDANGGYPAEYIAAIKKLPELLEKCTVRFGSYSKPRTIALKNAPQNDVDRLLIPLKQSFMEGSESAARQVHAIAESEGRKWGKIFSESTGFAYRAHIQDFNTDQAVRNAHLSYEVMHWSITTREAYEKGFYSTYKGRFNKRAVLPLDPNMAAFVTPAANMGADSIEEARSLRTHEQTRDDTAWRKKLIAEFAKQARHAISRP